MSKKKIACPFCGLTNQLATKEHVWAQWLHESPAGSALLAEAHGERIPNQHVILSQDEAGRLTSTSGDVGSIAKYLPHVTVSVCGSCNSGWMSGLENAIKASLGPYVYGEVKNVKLDVSELKVLAGWAVKTFLAYYLTRSAIENPFDSTDYLHIASSGEPPPRCSIWLMSSHHPAARVGMGVYSTFFSSPSLPIPDATTPNNSCMAYVAVGRAVFVLMRWPDHMPDEIRMTCTPPQLHKYGTRQIWPCQRAQYFPLEEVPWDQFDGFLNYPVRLSHSMALPALGLTDDERRQVYQEFINGASPQDLGSKWTRNLGSPSDDLR